MDVVNDVFRKVTSAAREVYDGTLAQSKQLLVRNAFLNGSLQSINIKKSLQYGIEHFLRQSEREPLKDIVLRKEFSDVERMLFTPGQNIHMFPSGPFDIEASGLKGFRRIMKEYHITTENLINSITSGELREFANPAKSGSLFYVTENDQFILKTVRDYESRFFKSDLLSDYYHNLANRKRSFLAKYYGMYAYRLSNSVFWLRFVIMSNIIPSTLRINERFDLKGSTKGRTAGSEEVMKQMPVFKDNDFLIMHPEGIHLHPSVYDPLKVILEGDVEILKGWRIMDYSLLIGIHNRDNPEMSQPPTLPSTRSIVNHIVNYAADYDNPDSAHTLGCFDGIHAYNRPMYNLFPNGINKEFMSDPIVERYGGIPGVNYRNERVVLFLGIIDILQTYDTNKQVQNYLQGSTLISKCEPDDESSRSIVDPNLYANRFLNFVFTKVLLRDETMPSAPAHTTSYTSESSRYESLDSHRCSRVPAYDDMSKVKMRHDDARMYSKLPSVASQKDTGNLNPPYPEQSVFPDPNKCIRDSSMQSTKSTSQFYVPVPQLPTSVIDPDFHTYSSIESVMLAPALPSNYRATASTEAKKTHGTKKRRSRERNNPCINPRTFYF